MRTLKLTIAYDGTRYAGWQAQKSSTKHQALSTQHTAHRKEKPTIQGTLERVLGQILQEQVKVVGSGRTDAGVHAQAQVAHVRTRAEVSCQRLLRSLNQLLPPDIALMRVEEAPASFHARFHARRKRYRYRISTAEAITPFARPYVHQVRSRLNLALMRREAAALKGRHNFRGFAAAHHDAHSTTRTMTNVQLRRRGQELSLEIEGNGFLHTMVRSIAGTLLDIGRGRLAPGTIRRILRTRDRRLAGTTAPPQGLTLLCVEYG